MDTHGGQSLGVGGLDSQQPGNEAPISVPAQRGTPAGDLVDAIFSDDVERCRQLLDAHPELLNTPLRHRGYLRTPREDSAWPYTGGDNDYQGITPLVFASLVPRFREPRLDSRAPSSSGLAIIELLVGRGASLESRPGVAWWKDVLFHETCRDYDSPEAMELLARAGADYHTKMLNDYCYSVLQAAAARGAVRTVGFLLNRGVPMHHIHQGEEDGRADYGRPNGTPLHAAATNGRCDVVRLLLDRGAVSDLETLDWHGRTPLLCASRGPFSHEVDAKRGSWEETVRLLVDAGADLTALDQRDLDWSPYVFDQGAFRDTPLGHVSAWGSGDIVRYLADRGADIHRRCSYPKEESFPYVAAGNNVTPLHRAALNWNADAVQALLNLGADPAASDEYGRQAQHWATMRKCVSEWRGRNEFSLVWGDVLVDPAQKITLLKRLTAMESTISHLLCATTDSRGVLGRQDAFGRTPLHYAAYVKLVRAIVLLLEGGGGGGVDDVGQADNEGRTALHHLVDALYHPHNREPVDGDLADERLGVTLSTYIRDRQDHDIVDRTDHSGFTALHIAARAASYNAVALLLRLGADPNARVAKNGSDDNNDDEVGLTALHLTMRCPVWVPLGTYEPEEYKPWKRQAARIKELLLAAGADVGICDSRGRTAAQVEAAVDEELRRERAEYLVRRDQFSAEWARRCALDSRGFGRGRAGPRPVPVPAPDNSGAQQSPYGSGVGRGRGL